MDTALRVAGVVVLTYSVGFLSVYLSRIGLRNSSVERGEIADGLVVAAKWPWYTLKGVYELWLQVRM